MGIFSIIGNLGLGDFDESKILDNDSGARGSGTKGDKVTGGAGERSTV